MGALAYGDINALDLPDLIVKEGKYLSKGMA